MHLSNIKLIRNTIYGSLAALLLVGCSAKKNVIYIQDAMPDEVVKTIGTQEIKIAPGDEIMVFVSCDDVETSQRLSLMAGLKRPEFNSVNSSVYSTSIMLPYLVNEDGDIDMPMIGNVHVGGLTRKQAAAEVVKRVIEDKLAKPGSVNANVQFANLSYSVIGEVAHTGNYSITDDDITILEALSIAGDLTIHGRRDRVWVIREQPDGSRKTYLLDLRDTKFMESPAYYIAQNDVIYVEPNTVRAGQSTINENTFKSVGFWTSLVSVAISITTLIVTLTK